MFLALFLELSEDSQTLMGKGIIWGALHQVGLRRGLGICILTRFSDYFKVGTILLRNTVLKAGRKKAKSS